MSFTFENQGTNTYLVYEIGANDELDTMSLGMLTNNAIPGFAVATFTQMDTSKFIKYNVSAKVSAAQLFSGPVNRRRLVGVFTGIINAMISAEDYMLDTDSILLDLDYIFTDVTTCETFMICLPVMNREQKNPDLSAFFKNIVFSMQYDQTENCDHVAQILNHLNSTPVLSLANFKELLDNIGKAQGPVRSAQPQAQAEAPRAAAQPQVQAAPVMSSGIQSAPIQSAPIQSAPIQSGSIQSGSIQSGIIQSGTIQSQMNMSGNKPNPQMNQSVDPFAQVNIPGRQDKMGHTAMPQPESNEKPMSMFYLMQHYNKENAAAYKAQKNAKKAQKASGNAKNSAPKPQKNAGGKQNKNAPQMNTGFAVPGQQPASINSGFAIPGQQPAQINPGFAMPGQQPAPINSGFAAPKQPDLSNSGFIGMNQQPAAPKKPAQPVVKQEPQPQVQQPFTPAFQQPAMQPANPISFGETTVLGGGQIGETTVLGGAVEQVKNDPHLIRTKNNERIPLNKPVFRIGKERSYVDYFIGDNTAISRSHANIVNHDGEFFVVDTNSTNHTYVNGGMIASNVETKLSHGTKIKLANEDFEFRMY